MPIALMGAEGLSEYRDLLRRLVETVQHSTGAKILFCLTMAPLREQFLENAPAYFNTSRATRQRFADDVTLYLDEARRIAQDERWPLADVASEIHKRIASGEKSAALRRSQRFSTFIALRSASTSRHHRACHRQRAHDRRSRTALKIQTLKIQTLKIQPISS